MSSDNYGVNDVNNGAGSDDHPGAESANDVNNDSSPRPRINRLYEDDYEGAQILEHEQYESEKEGRHDEGEGIDDNGTSPRCGDKRPRSPTDSDSVVRWRKPIKAHPTAMGLKPRARDYEPAVIHILGEAIPLYRCYLSTDTPYPVPMDEIKWAKSGWQFGCEECETKIGFNDEMMRSSSW